MRGKSNLYSRLRRVVAACLAACVVLVSGAPSRADSLEGSNKELTRIRDAAGKPCLRFRMQVRPDITMPTSFEHIVLATNSCPQRIDVKICYRGSRAGCKTLKLLPFGDGLALLGFMNNRPSFAFDYDESEGN